jgi:hypothetical protein
MASARASTTGAAPSATPIITTVLAPISLNAFALTPKCAENTNYKLAPITQPNYTFLRLHDKLIEADVLDAVDLHSVSPANLNPRLTNLGKATANAAPDAGLRENRLGVYLHWTLPQVYRSGNSAAGPDSTVDRQAETKRLVSCQFSVFLGVSFGPFPSPKFLAPLCFCELCAREAVSTATKNVPKFVMLPNSLLVPVEIC